MLESSNAREEKGVGLGGGLLIPSLCLTYDGLTKKFLFSQSVANDRPGGFQNSDLDDVVTTSFVVPTSQRRSAAF